LRVGVIGEGGLSLLVPCVLSQSVLCHLSLAILVASHIRSTSDAFDLWRKRLGRLVIGDQVEWCCEGKRKLKGDRLVFNHAIDLKSIKNLFEKEVIFLMMSYLLNWLSEGWQWSEDIKIRWYITSFFFARISHLFLIFSCKSQTSTGMNVNACCY
jgi:hypothetical protein